MAAERRRASERRRIVSCFEMGIALKYTEEVWMIGSFSVKGDDRGGGGCGICVA